MKKNSKSLFFFPRQVAGQQKKTFTSAFGTHVGPRPLLACQFLLLRVGGGQFQVEHRLQPGGASVDPLAPLIVLINIKRHTGVTLHFAALSFGPAGFFRLTYQEQNPDQAAVHLLHSAPPPGALPLCLDDLPDF